MVHMPFHQVWDVQYLDDDFAFRRSGSEVQELIDLKRRRRYFGVLRKYYLSEEESRWLDEVVGENLYYSKPGYVWKRKRLLKKVQILFSILNVWYEFFVSTDYKKVFSILRYELDDLEYKTFCVWCKYKRRKECIEKFGYSQSSFYLIMKKIDQKLESSDVPGIRKLYACVSKIKELCRKVR